MIDKGIFPHIAWAMARQCKKVYYTGPPEQVMRRLRDDIIGQGFNNITRIESFWDVEDECDVFVFTDVGFAAEQRKLIRDGRNVWGHRGGDVIEVNKGTYIETLKELGMEVPPHEVVIGIDNLLDYLWDKEKKFVKVSKWRDDWETFCWRDRDLDSAYLHGHPFNRSPIRDLVKFYVFDEIKGNIEDGIDTWCIDGQWPKTVLHAMERKDKSLIGGIQEMSEIDESVRGVNEILGPYLGYRFGYRGAFSTEVRPPYLIDPTCRFGSPPSQLQSVLITNLPEVIYRGSQGELVEPDYQDPIGAQVLITTDREKEDWLAFKMDPALRPFVLSSFSFQDAGELCIAPNTLENFAGWLVATGPTMKSVIETLKERKEMLPSGFDCDITSLADLLRELEDAEKVGITISDETIPSPEEVVS